MRITLSILLAVLLTALFTTSSSCKTRTLQQNPPDHTSVFDYTAAWTKVDSFERLQQYQSALALSLEIQRTARSEMRDDQVVRSAVYINKYAVYLNEDGMEAAISGMEEALQEAQEPAKSVLFSMTAQIYDAYLDAHLWDLRHRTNTEAVASTDIRTWDIADFIGKINAYYFRSLAYPGLGQIPVTKFTDILSGNDKTDYLRPTLYDILAQRAIDYFSDEPAALTAPVDAYVMTNIRLLDPAAAFMAQSDTATDSISYQLKAIQLFRDLMRFHEHDASPDALIDIDLKRLSYVYEYLEHEEKAGAYLDALESLQAMFPSSGMTAEVGYAKALFYANRASAFTASPDDPYRYDLRTAIQICDHVIAAYPGSKGAQECQNLKAGLIQPNLSLLTEEVILKGERPLISVTFQNVSQIRMRVVRLKHENDKKLQGRNNDILDYLRSLSAVQEHTFDLPLGDDYRPHQTELVLDPLPYGYYALLISDDAFDRNSLTAFSLFHVSDLAYWTYGDQESQELVVVDRKTGAPRKHVKVEFYSWEYDAVKRDNVLRARGAEYSDEHGVTPYTFSGNRNSLVAKLTDGDDVLFLNDNFYNFSRHGETKDRQAVYLFTDRAIYRPGQQVFVKGYLVNIDRRGMPDLLTSGKVVLTLLDVNGQEVAQQTFTPNTFGTFSGEFIAPVGRLNGRMSFRASGAGEGSAQIRVEEYKRPTFEVTFDPADQAYQLGQQVTVRGKAMTFAGVPVDGGEVAYRVVRKVSFPWFYWFRGPWIPDAPEMIISRGTVTTDATGAFSIAFGARGDRSIAKQRPEYRFEVITDVTDAAGETRSASKSILLADYSFKVRLDLPEIVEITALHAIPVHVTNLNQEPVSVIAQIQVDRLNSPDLPLRNRYWTMPDTLSLTPAQYQELVPAYAVPGKEDMPSWDVSRTLGTERYPIEGMDSLDLGRVIRQPGAYRIICQFTGSNGDTSSVTLYTQVFDQGKGLPEGVLFTQMTDHPAYQPGEQISHRLLSSRPLYIRYVTDKQKGSSLDWISVDGSSVRKTAVTEDDRGGMRLHGIFVYDNRVNRFEQKINIPWYNKDLNIEYLSYRDKTEPGAREEWHLKISGSQKEGVIAEMLATMYDASLDAFVPHQWNWNLYPHYGGQGWMHPAGFSQSYLRYLFSRNYAEGAAVGEYAYRELKWFDFPFWDDRVMSRGKVFFKERMAAAPMQEMQDLMPSSILTDEAEGDQEEADNTTHTSTSQAPVALRSDLRETAFFMPHLVSDKDGNIILKFKMGESLTRWKFLALAHSKDLKYGFAEKEIVTQKDVMVFPHMPRFLRQKDTIYLSAKVFNTTPATLHGSASLRILEADTDKDVSSAFGLRASDQEITLPAEGSVGVQWRVAVPEAWTTPVKYQVIATSGNQGDGEEGVLPVLTDRIFVTETIAMHVPAQTDRTFVFESLQNTASRTLDHQRFTIEFTSNPAWLAVQSLPYLQEYPHQCAEQIWNRLYANQVARKIVASFPEIGETYARWTNDPNSVSLMSQLSRNQELKSALLEETPWVQDAMSEEEQMRNIAHLLDTDRITTETMKALQSLQEMQLTNGGFPWFPGGRDNRYITQYIVESAGHLAKLEAIDPAVYQSMMQIVYPAIRYTDDRILEEYEELGRRVKDGKTTWEADNLSHLAVHYLYARSFFRSQRSEPGVEKARSYYLSQAAKYWMDRPLYVQALLALSLQRWNQDPAVAAMRKSFEERALYREELGRYWKADQGYYWYQLPIERQALMIELFEELKAPQAWIDEMRLWLLTNKQTNRWSSTKSTAAAVYALLMQEDNWLSGVQVAIRVAGEPLQVTSAEAGSGYVRTSWPAGEVSREMAQININNPNNHVSWGGAYWQYFEDMDKVRSADGTPLKMHKSLLKQLSTDRGLELVDLKNAVVGDLLIARIEIEVDRDMEFVHLKDMRASGLEPVNVLSSYKWKGGLGYYESTGDLATNFFFDFLPRGKYVFEYPVRVAHAGSFSNGIATLQSMYAPEFSSHSGGLHLELGSK